MSRAIKEDKQHYGAAKRTAGIGNMKYTYSVYQNVALPPR